MRTNLSYPAHLLALWCLAALPGLAQAAGSPPLLALGDVGGNPAADHALLLGERVTVADPLQGKLGSASLAGDLFRERLAVAIPDTNGNGVAEIGVLGSDGAGGWRFGYGDASTGTILDTWNLPAGDRYPALDLVADYDADGSPLLVAWAVREDGSVRALLRRLDGSAVGTVSFGISGHLVDTAVVQRGSGSQLVALRRDADSGANRAAVRSLDNVAIRTLNFGGARLPFAIEALPDYEGVGALAFLGQSEQSNAVAVIVKRLSDSVTVANLSFGNERQPRDLVVVPVEGGSAAIGVLLQGPESARLSVQSLADDTQYPAIALAVETQWTAAAVLSDADDAGNPGVVVAGTASDASLRSRSYLLSGVEIGRVNFGPLEDVPEPLSVELVASRDATLYQTNAGEVANGGGEHVFVGYNGMGQETRTLLAFDPRSAIPAGSRIVDLELSTYMSMSRNLSMDVDILRLTSDWSEGPSNPGDGEGGGIASEVGDSTWVHRSYPDLFWTTPGGDFNPVPRGGGLNAAGFNLYTGTPELIEDLQRWLDLDRDNKGWTLVTVQDGVNDTQAMRFDSRTNPVPEQRPVLRVWYQPAQ